MKRLIFFVFIISLSFFTFGQNIKFVTDGNLRVKVYVDNVLLKNSFDTLCEIVGVESGLHSVKIISSDSLQWQNGVYFKPGAVFLIDKQGDSLHVRLNRRVSETYDIVEALNALGRQLDSLAYLLVGDNFCIPPSNYVFSSKLHEFEKIQDPSVRYSLIMNYLQSHCFYTWQIEKLYALIEYPQQKRDFLALAYERTKDKQNFKDQFGE